MIRRLAKAAISTVVVLGAASLGFLYYQNNQVPDLGVHEGRFTPLGPNPNGISSQATDPEKRVSPIPFKDSSAATMTALKRAIKAYGGASIKVETDDYLYVVFTTPLLRFRDDAEFWLDTEARVVEVRSASRAGRSDLGTNRKRYEKILDEYRR